ncbi:MAG TPA: NifU family protein [bacterium]|nr:NifU family protein [bacterium]
MVWIPARTVADELYTPLTRERTPVLVPAAAATATAVAVAVPDFRLGYRPPAADESPLVCYCFGVTRDTVRKVALAYQLHDVNEVRARTKAGGGCGSCHPDIEDLLAELWEEATTKGYVVLCHELGVTPGGDATATAEAGALAGLTNFQKIQRITEALNTHIRPLLQGDGGDIQLIDVEGNRVLITLVGACGTCPSSLMTLKGLVEERLRHHVSPELEVVSL